MVSVTTSLPNFGKEIDQGFFKMVTSLLFKGRFIFFNLKTKMPLLKLQGSLELEVANLLSKILLKHQSMIVATIGFTSNLNLLNFEL